jgi:MFS family permease
VGALAAGVLAHIYGDISWVFLLSAVIFLASFALAATLPPVEEVRHRVPLFPKQLISRNLHIYLPLLVRHSGAMAIWTFWPLYLLELGADYLWVGIIQFVNPLTQFVFMYVVTDRVKTTLLFPAGLVISAVTMVSFALASNVYELLPTQLLLGVSWGCTYVGALRHVTEASSEKATATGLLNSTTSLSAIIGPLVATALVAVTGDYRSTMYLASVAALVGLLLYHLLARRASLAGEVTSGT